MTLALKANEFSGGLNQANQQAAAFARQFRATMGGGLGGVEKDAAAFAQRLQGTIGKGLKAVGGYAKVALGGIGLAAAAGFGMAIRSSIQTNAQLETTRLQFTTLMGSADQAAEHVATLFEIAKKTPFETGPIIAASLKLQTFGGAALNTKDNIILLGDAAAATNAPIDELGFWVGRMYAAIQGGQPFGEAAMRLQELAVMTPQARQEMEQLQAAGASAEEVFGVFQSSLGKFTGAMEKQASTWSGLWSTVSDQVKLLVAEGFQGTFETAKGAMQELVETLNDPAVTEGVKALAEELGKAASSAIELFDAITQNAAAKGLERVNEDAGILLGLNEENLGVLKELYEEARRRSGADGFFVFGEENLKFQQAYNEILQEEYGLVLQQAEGYQALSEARMEDARAVEVQVEAIELSGDAIRAASIDAEDLDWALAMNAVAVDMAAEKTTDYATDLSIWGDNANIARHNAEMLGQALGYDAEQTNAARAALEAYNAAFLAVQGDYVTELPGADKPLVTPARDVAITTGGLSPEQVALLEQYREEAQKAQQEIYNLTNGLGTYGLEQEKVNERVAAAQGELEYYNALMAPLAGVVGTTAVAHQAMAVNVDAAKQAIYDQLVQMGAAPEVVTAYGVAIGIMSEEQRTAALTAAAVKIETERLAQLIAEGMPVEQALADLDAFIDKIENGLAPAVVTAAADVPAGIVMMKEQMAEEALLAGAGLMTGLESGITDNAHLATTAAETAAGDVISGTANALGVESPSTITAAMGRNLMHGLRNGVDEVVATVVNRMQTVGGNIIGGLVAGINGAKQLVMNAIQAIADAIPDWLKQFLGINSPAKATTPIGRAVVEGVVEGVVYSERTLQVALRKLVEGMMATLDVGSQLSSIGSGFATRFSQQVVEPMAAQLAALDETLGAARTLFDETAQAAGREEMFADWADPAQYDAALRQLATLRQELALSGNWLGMMQVDDALGALRERNALNQEYVRAQERLAALQRAQADMAFLQSQVELLALIAEHAEDLPADLLAGVQFGSEADPGPLLDAMTAALEQQAAEVNEALGGSRALQQIMTDGIDAPERIVNWVANGDETFRQFAGSVEDFWGWLRGRQFDINVRIGEIPEWAIPGSPLPIHTAWVKFAEAMQGLDFGDQVETFFGRILTTGDAMMAFLMSMPDELAGLTENINAVVFQNLDAFIEYFDVVQAGGEDLQELLDLFANYFAGEELNQDSSMYEFFQEMLSNFPDEVLPFLEDLAQLVADGAAGVQEYINSLIDLAETVEEIQGKLDLAKKVGNLAAGFGDYFEIQVLRPLEAQLDGATDVIGAMVSDLADIAAEQFGGSLDMPDIMDLPTEEAIWQLQALRHALMAAGSAEGVAQADAIIDALMERNRLEREYEEQQQRLLRLEEQRAQLAFLQQQLDLIRLVTEEGLDASILSGLQFGLMADAGALMDAMTAVMEALIQTAQDGLMIHSPSRPFVEFGQNVMESLALGVEDRLRATQQRLERGIGQVIGGLEDPAAALDDLFGHDASDGTRTPAEAIAQAFRRNGEGLREAADVTPAVMAAAFRRTRTIINGGYHVTINGEREEALEQLQRQAGSGQARNARLVDVL